MRTLHDLVCVVRYGPKTIAELFNRELSVTGSVTLIPTAYMQRVRELRLKLFGRRHCINAKERKGKGQKKGLRVDATHPGQSKTQIAQAQHKSAKTLASTCNPRDVTVFGAPLQDLRCDIDDVEMSNRAGEILKNYTDWLGHRLRQAKSEHSGRFAVKLTAKQKQNLREKQMAKEALRQRVNADLRGSVSDDVLVYIDNRCSIKKADVPPQFSVSVCPWTARVLVVPTLDAATNLMKKANLDPPIFAAILHGRRVTSFSYLLAAAKLLASDRTASHPIDDFKALPPSVKFSAAVTHDETHLLLDGGVWMSECGNSIQCLESACKLKGCRWTVYRAVDASRRELFEKLKKDADETGARLQSAKVARAKAKAAAKSEETGAVRVVGPRTVAGYVSKYVRIDSLATLHTLLRHKARPDTSRSTTGKFLAVAQSTRRR